MGLFQTFNAYSNLYPKPDQNTKNKNNVFFKMKKECYLGGTKLFNLQLIEMFNNAV